MYPVTGALAFTICDEYYQAVPWPRQWVKSLLHMPKPAYAEARAELKICFLPYRVTYFWLYLMIDFKYRCKLNRECFVKCIYTFPGENMLIYKEICKNLFLSSHLALESFLVF